MPSFLTLMCCFRTSFLPCIKPQLPVMSEVGDSGLMSRHQDNTPRYIPLGLITNMKPVFLAWMFIGHSEVIVRIWLPFPLNSQGESGTVVASQDTAEDGRQLDNQKRGVVAENLWLPTSTKYELAIPVYLLLRYIACSPISSIWH